jgi:hypothetical protein
MSTNRVSVLVAAVLGTRLSSVTSATVAITAVTIFEAICVRVSTGSFNCVVPAIYRPRSETVTASYFDELARARMFGYFEDPSIQRVLKRVPGYPFYK